jgi:protein tyrosine phosphatase
VEETRVKLHYHGSGATSDYINANYIKFDSSSNLFIATQAPLSSYLSEFWLMVYQQNCPVIVALNRLIEGGKVKGNSYWPNKDGDEVTLGLITVKLIKTINFPEVQVVVRQLKIANSMQPQEGFREIFQIHYLGWPDFGVPESTAAIREIAHAMEHCRKLGNQNGLHGPCVVHCSAGIGRTGSYLAIVQAISTPKFQKLLEYARIEKSLREGKEEMRLDSILSQFSVKDLVWSLRCQRNCGTVQNVKQYQFIYRALKDEILYPSFPSTIVNALPPLNPEPAHLPLSLDLTFDDVVATHFTQASPSRPGADLARPHSCGLQSGLSVVKVLVDVQTQE